MRIWSRSFQLPRLWSTSGNCCTLQQYGTSKNRGAADSGEFFRVSGISTLLTHKLSQIDAHILYLCHELIGCSFFPSTYDTHNSISVLYLTEKGFPNTANHQPGSWFYPILQISHRSFMYSGGESIIYIDGACNINIILIWINHELQLVLLIKKN